MPVHFSGVGGAESVAFAEQGGAQTDTDQHAAHDSGSVDLCNELGCREPQREENAQE